MRHGKLRVIIISRKFIAAFTALVLPALLCSAVLIIKNAHGSMTELGGKTIVIDPGHGGVDGGAVSRYILEKDINLNVALFLRKKLESSGAKVIMTRTEDVELGKSKKIDRNRYIMDLNVRVSIINNSGADMFISIHTNSNVKKPSTRGAIAFYCNSHPHNREMAYIFQNVFNTMEFNYGGNAYKSHHIPQKGNYYVLRNAKIPGIIVETGFLTNSTDIMLLQKSEYQEYLSEAIYKGIVDYFSVSHRLPTNIENTVDIEEENLIKMHEEVMERH